MAFLGILIFMYAITTVPQVIADGIAALKAASAGDWDALDRQRDRRDAQRQSRRDRWTSAWSGIRSKRAASAGGRAVRPGFWAYLDDIYYGFWERKSQSLKAKGPEASDFDRRIQAAVDEHLGRMRDRYEGETAEADTGSEDSEPVPAETSQAEPDAQQGTSTTDPAPIVAPTSQGAATMTDSVGDIQNNEALRANLELQAKASADLEEAVASAESALAILKGLANDAGDATQATKFDSTATAYISEIVDTISVGTLSHWHELADNSRAGAQNAYDALEKYRDAEDVVASQGIDASTLEPVH